MMGLIEHGEGWIAVPDNTDARWISEAEVSEYRAYGWFVDGPVVRAEQLADAVEEREQLRGEAVRQARIGNGAMLEADGLREERDRYKAALDKLRLHPLLTRAAGPLEQAALQIVKVALRGWQ